MREYCLRVSVLVLHAWRGVGFIFCIAYESSCLGSCTYQTTSLSSQPGAQLHVSILDIHVDVSTVGIVRSSRSVVGRNSLVLATTPIVRHLSIQLLRRLLRSATHNRTALLICASSTSASAAATLSPLTWSSATFTWCSTAPDRRPRATTWDVAVHIWRRESVLLRTVASVSPPTTSFTAILSSCVSATLDPVKKATWWLLHTIHQ